MKEIIPNNNAMNKEQIERLIKKYIVEHQEGVEIENPKVDFKTEWYELENEDSRSEFLKDVTAIANTVGLDGFLIIGYNEKSKTFNNSTVADSKKKEVDIMNLINRHVDGDLTVHCHDIKFKKHKLCVIHIPPQFDKPFVVVNFKKNGKDSTHRIYVRKGTQNKIATKYDLDFIYYDRKNVVPEYGFNCYVQNFSFQPFYGTQWRIILAVVFENFGLKPIAIEKITVKIPIVLGYHFFEIIYNGLDTQSQSLKQNPLIIKRGNMEKYPYLTSNNFNLDINVSNNLTTYINNAEKIEFHFHTVTGKVFEKNLEI